ncbi:hypothetical protein PA598K_04080 [Paenibacillus sp. 598K]|uniref:hypothetical protein n=1 Tax=Paenibacillus sp. 598K TaxID=1117987 RepID=UPI000FF9E567|nr:hypothetical protein [Paenibacillus sp. 598K]GBF75659.1 hypothetical protein PA598K_04080 [Paenibacillus sp. 598K]
MKVRFLVGIAAVLVIVGIGVMGCANRSTTSEGVAVHPIPTSDTTKDIAQDTTKYTAKDTTQDRAKAAGLQRLTEKIPNYDENGELRSYTLIRGELPSDSEWSAFLLKITTEDDVNKQLSLAYGRLNGLVGAYENYKQFAPQEWSYHSVLNFFRPGLYDRLAEVTSDTDKANTLRKVAELITLPHIHAYASTIDDLQVTPDDIKALQDVYNLIKTITLAE